jgi:4'-phosphopantetheinyl transferase
MRTSIHTSMKVEVRDCGHPGDSGVPELPPDGVDVWTCSLQTAPSVENACYELLSPEERDRASRYRAGKPRTDFVLTRGNLRSLVARYLAVAPHHVAFGFSSHGKPFLHGPSDLRFNVSHTDGLALLAFVRTHEIGIDVEKITPEPDVRKLAERFFSIHERRALEPLAGEELRAAFFRCWTRKEAYVKARGEGLSVPLHEFDVSVAAGDNRALLATRPDPTEAQRWTLQDLRTAPGYAAALAFREP